MATAAFGRQCQSLKCTSRLYDLPRLALGDRVSGTNGTRHRLDGDEAHTHTAARFRPSASTRRSRDEEEVILRLFKIRFARNRQQPRSDQTAQEIAMYIAGNGPAEATLVATDEV
jgi:hypothetical protein